MFKAVKEGYLYHFSDVKLGENSSSQGLVFLGALEND